MDLFVVFVVITRSTRRFRVICPEDILALIVILFGEPLLVTGSLTAVAQGWKNCNRPKLPSSSGRAFCDERRHCDDDRRRPKTAKAALCSRSPLQHVVRWDRSVGETACEPLTSKSSPKRITIRARISMHTVCQWRWAFSMPPRTDLPPPPSNNCKLHRAINECCDTWVCLSDNPPPMFHAPPPGRKWAWQFRPL